MTLTRLASTIFVLSAAACVSPAPISQSPCPCPEAMGYICCENRCVLPADPICGSTAGMSGAGGTMTQDAGSAAGNPPVGTGGAAGTEVHDAGGTAGGPPVGADAGQVVSPVVSVGIGAAHACIVRANGSIECRGSNDKGQATPPAGTFLQVVAGAEHTCGQVQNLADRTKNGAWVCWGDNTYGQAPPSLGVLLSLTAGSRHTCGMDYTNDKIVCFGDNSLGQTSAPALPTLPSGSVVTMSAGRNHTCAIINIAGPPPTNIYTSSVRCWGDNSLGQSTPPSMTQNAGFVASGGDHTCAGTPFFLTCWGDNTLGQSTAPVGSTFDLSLASGHSCFINSLFGSGPIDCWGTGWGSSLPTPPTGMFGNVFAGDYINCALPMDATQPLVCWGQAYEPWY
jgi:Regulator of chromosome condensation (RCC1) repeat